MVQEKIEKLTKNQRIVFSHLDRVNKALTAYEILDDVREDGIKAPVQVYRALDKLVDQGLIHRIESRNAFMVCHAHDHPHGVSFAICDQCDQIQEIDMPLPDDMQALIQDQVGFKTDRAMIELHGICQKCAK